MSEEQNENTVQLTIDGNSVTVQKGTTVHAAAEQLGIKVPIFCYHDRMPPFGACRICLVEIEGQGGLKTSCTTEAADGMVVKTMSDKAVRGRNEIMELLLINHPLDCPVCDRGGECPLQEHAMHHGPGTSRFFEEKRHFKKPVSRGPVLMLDRERCIACARCTRFGELVAGDNALELIHRGYETEVGTPDGGPAKSKFIGNTIMICPVGALTSQVYRFRARPWDNDSMDSTCTLCPVGCSLTLDSRDGEIMRTRSCENKDVNDVWLCDKGWFGYEFSSHPDRLQTPLVRRNGKLEEVDWDEALSLAAEKLANSEKSAALGGNPLTVEENYLFQKLMREGVKTAHLDHRIGMPILSRDEEGVAPGMDLVIGEIEDLDFAVLLGTDLSEEFPVLWLRLKQAINKGAKVFYQGNFAPETAKFYHEIEVHRPGKELDIWEQLRPAVSDLASKGKRGALFLGRQILHSPMRLRFLEEMQKFQKEFPDISLNLLEGNGNSRGARFAGMHPTLLPGGRPTPTIGLNVHKILEKAGSEGWDLLYVAGADPAARMPSALWNRAKEKLGCLIVQDLFLTKTAEQADIVLPVHSFLEKEGHFINIEGRVEKIHPGKMIPSHLLSDGEIFTRLAEKLDVSLKIDETFSAKLQSERIEKETASLSMATSREEIKPEGLVGVFTPALFDQGIRMQHNTHLSQNVKKPGVRIHPDEAEKRGLADGESAEFSANGNKIDAPLILDRKVARGTLVFPVGFDAIPVYELQGNLLNAFPVEVKKL